MKVKLSLKQSWTLIVLLSVITPVAIVMLWYGTTLYKHELNNALDIEHQANEHLQFRVESEVNRLRTLLKNKSDPLSFLVDPPVSAKDIKRINTLLQLIVRREHTIHGAILVTTDGNILAIYDPDVFYATENALTADEKTVAAIHWGFEDAQNTPELVIPSLGRTYIGSVTFQHKENVFKMAVPVGQPVKAVLTIELDAERLLDSDAHKKHNKNNAYILGRRGNLITEINDTVYQPGDILTHLEIVRAALINAAWPRDKTYTGINNQQVYGTLTTISSLGWSLISEVSTEKIIRPIWQSLAEMLLLTLIVMLVFVWFVLYLAKKTLTPIQQASEAIDHVANGNYQFSLQTTGILELDAMSAGINRMTKARQKVENALQENEQDLIITLNSIGDAVIACDAQGLVTRMNPVAQHLTGWSIEKAKGQKIKNIFNIINATTRQPIENPVDKVLSTGETVYLSNHTTLISKNGREYQIADSAAPLRNGDDNILGMVLVFNDVTEQYRLREQAINAQKKLQNKEKEQRDILDSMVNSVISIDEGGTILSFNKAAENLFGYKLEEIKNKNIKCLMPEPYAKEHDGYIQHFLDTSESNIVGLGREVEGKHKSNKIFPLRISIAKLPKGTDGKLRLIGSYIDLTYIKQQEEQLRRSQKMDALGKLTGGIAHDYNNMLGVVTGYAELLENALADKPKLARYANRINHAGQRGASLTKKLLSFSKQESIDADDLDINLLLRDMHHMLEKTLTVRVSLQYILADNLWRVWLCSSDLEDVILNLAINAMHAIEGNGKLTIQTQNEFINTLDAKLLDLEAAGDYVKLIITDTGCGMNDETKDKIFDPFYSTKGDKGTGLGLSQVYGFIERSKGAVKVYSEPEKGSEFVLFIPRHYQVDEQLSPTETQRPADQKGYENILVVDDEQDLLTLCTEILEKNNYGVFSADNAKQALDILNTENIDLVLSDVLMPDMDGFQLAAIIKEKYPKIKIQLASGFTDNRHSGNEDDYLQKNLLSKPFNSQVLLQRIRKLLDR